MPQSVSEGLKPDLYSPDPRKKKNFASRNTEYKSEHTRQVMMYHKDIPACNVISYACGSTRHVHIIICMQSPPAPICTHSPPFAPFWIISGSHLEGQEKVEHEVEPEVNIHDPLHPEPETLGLHAEPLHGGVEGRKVALDVC